MPKPLSELPLACASRIEWLLTDVDDTLTWQGKLPPDTLTALQHLEDVGVKVVAVTGACAGWCDQIARLWPLHGVIGENGAFWMRKDDNAFHINYLRNRVEMQKDQKALYQAISEILSDYPEIQFAQDQAFRFSDVAVDLGQDVTAVSTQLKSEIAHRVRNIKVNGSYVNATLSSIHLNAWVGDYSKRATGEAYVRSHNQGELPELSKLAYVGDSLNDEGMFAWLSTTIGVANITPVLNQLDAQPAYLTERRGGFGFAQLAKVIVKAKS
ncbi:HAD-IIB family hydrolase [Vibrio japonicus]|uniref:HAD-IIB family hydrolase n=1 Tax=Vibrio japonicus TaxID=1824638 RepID=A0ABY5LP59_9VIBR|nr:HAD-IIB family hydrolase [Vibrio japonicus]UUM32862.1 HAD-IIB family hydrolase [Vibrio japonicus]